MHSISGETSTRERACTVHLTLDNFSLYRKARGEAPAKATSPEELQSAFAALSATHTLYLIARGEDLTTLLTAAAFMPALRFLLLESNESRDLTGLLNGGEDAPLRSLLRTKPLLRIWMHSSRWASSNATSSSSKRWRVSSPDPTGPFARLDMVDALPERFQF